jgi:hypothetical protein
MKVGVGILFQCGKCTLASGVAKSGQIERAKNPAVLDV